MSAHSSQASVALTSALSAQECESCGRRKQIRSVDPSCATTGRVSRATRMCATCRRETPHLLIFSVAVSHAKTSAWQGGEPGLAEPARVFGPSSLGSFASLDPDMSSWRTSQLSLLEASTEFSETWPRAGMTRSGTAYLLRPLVPLTAAIASGSLPTPLAGGGSQTGSNRKKWGGINTLDAMAREGWWPTPSVKGNYNRKGASAKSGDGLATAVSKAETEKPIFPTPTQTDAHKGYASPPGETNDRGRQTLSGAVNAGFKTPTAAPFSHGGSGGELHKQVAPNGGPLNPPWVAWLMGFPIDWTSLPPSATPSSRRSRSGSGGASSKRKAA